MVLFHLPICLIVTGQDMTMEEMVNHIGIPSPSSRSPTRPVQQQWYSWWSSSGPPSPHIISGEAELPMATVRFALVGVCYISEEHAR